jgi:hypothetical protein
MNINFRPITIKDINLRIKWLADSEVNFGLGISVRNGLTLKQHQDWFKRYLAEEKIGQQKIYIILNDDVPIGQVGLYDINKEDKNAILYIVIGEKEYWGKGIGIKAIEFIHDYAKNILKLHKINLNVHEQNKKALSLYKKCGYKIVGTMYDNIIRDGKFENELMLENIF